MSAPVSRAAFLGGGLAGAAALAGCGGGPVRLAPAVPADFDDATIGRVLAGTALLATAFCERAAAVRGFTPAEAQWLRSAAGDERVHHAAIALAFGPGIPSHLRLTFPEGTFATPAAAIAGGVALQGSTLGSYLGAVSGLQAPELRSLVARIAANTARNLQELTFLRASAPGVSASIPDVLTTREAARVVAPYLG